MKFKIGDRVRIVGVRYPKNSSNVGKCGTIVSTYGKHDISPFPGYQVEIDNTPSPCPPLPWVCSQVHLTPLTDPDAEAWTAFQRYLQPDPAVILAKEPA